MLKTNKWNEIIEMEHIVLIITPNVSVRELFI